MMSRYAIFNGLLIDGNGGNPTPDAVVLVEGEKITAAGSASRIEIPGDAEKIDACGGAILPGFIDAHVHVTFDLSVTPDLSKDPFSLRFFRAPQYMKQTLEAGITSVRDAGFADLGLKRATEMGMVSGPRLQISGMPLGITGGHIDTWLPSGILSPLGAMTVPYPGMPYGIVDGVDAVRKRVREVLRSGVDTIKIMATGGVLSPTDHPEFTQFSREELDVIIQEANFRRGVKVMAHAQGVEGIKQAVRAGVHSIEHGMFLDDEAIDLMCESGTFLVPTLLAAVSIIEGEKYPDYAREKAREVFEEHKASIRKAYKAGVKISMGTDAGAMAHGTNLRELSLMCGIGMTPMESIIASTKTASECLCWEDRVGTIEPGKLADIVIAETNPLDDISTLANNHSIKVVMQGGKVVKNLG